MKLQQYLLLLLLWLQCPLALANYQISLFVPRTSDFWQRLSLFTQSAADDIGVRLTVYNANDSPQRMLEQVRQALKQGSDGILFMNYAGVGESILKIAEQYNTPALLINTALDDPTLIPRVQYPHWIGSITPDDRDTGIRLITRLIEQARQNGAERFNVLAFIGQANSRAHARRFEGLQSVVEARDDTHLIAILADTKDFAQAQQVYQAQIRAHPDINIVWSYSDQFSMAAGEVDKANAAKQHRVFGGIDWRPDALQSLQQNTSDVDFGGHIFDGAQGIILLYDYLNGLDFADERLQWNSAMVAARRSNVATIRNILSDPAKINYRNLSKAYNRQRLQYRFELDTLPLKRSPFQFSNEELQWLQQHPTIRLGVDRGWKPLEYIDDKGHYQGLSSSYMDYLRRVIGLQYAAPKKMPWQQVLTRLQHREIDVAPLISVTEARKQYLNFTQPYLSLPLIIFNREGESLLGGLADLSGKKVAVIEGYSVNKLLQRNHPRIERVYVDSVQDGLNALSTRQVDAYIDVLAVGGYQIAAGGYTNLQVAATTPYQLDFSIGVRKDWPELVSIFNKVLGSISEQKKNEFLRQWLTVRYAQKTDFTIAFWILGFSVFILLLFTWRGRVLSRANAKLLEANARVEESSRVKSQFLANMSHEIRTPMNAIVGLGHLLSRTELNLKQADYIQKLQKSAHSLLGLIDDILDVSRIEAGQLKIEHIEFNLEQLLNELAELAQMRLGDKDIEFIYDLDSDVPTVMLGDPFRLNQILTNLVSNAIKFTDSGNILLKVCVMERNENSVKLKFNVSDNGIGIEAEKLDTLFEPFVQEDGSTTRRYGGSGLGLSISRQLTQLMHGEMGVQSTKGVGSTFHFTLPFELPDITGQNTLLSLPEPDLRGLHILLVDDNQQTLEILSHMLQSMTFNVVCASSGAQALTQISQQQKPFDLILLDWRMPELDGKETAIEIRRLKPAPKTPIIIMMRAYGREASEQNLLEKADVDGFLIKPVTPSLLFNTIMQAYHLTDKNYPPSTMTRHELPETLSGTVLLAEDNQINQQVASEILQQMGLDVHICENGIEVVSSLSSIQPDVILMDIQMPLMDGYQATQEIRNMQQYAHLPIIAMTANAMNEDSEKSLQCGMNEHINKPVDPQHLFNILKKYLPSESVENTTLDNQAATDKKWPRKMPGLDIQQGIKQVGGNEQLYQKLLSDFLANYHNLVDTLQQHLQQGAIDQADRLMHTVKGVSANIGAVRLMQIATEINNQIHHNQQVKTDSVQKLASACDELFGSLRQLTKQRQTNDVDNQQPLDSEQLIQIKKLLQNSDAEAHKLLQQHRDALAKQIGDQPVQQIIQLTRSYEFEQALQQLEKALRENPSDATE